MTSRFLSLVIALIISGTPAAAANAGQTAFTYQGQLKSNGAPLTGTVDITARVFDVASGGTALATDTFQNIAVTDGLVTLELNFGSGLFTGGERWLELEVEGNTLSPRQPIHPAPYAMLALTAANSAQWASSGSAIMNQNTGFVGINRDYTVGLEWFGVHAPVNSGYGGMYVTTEGANAWPFYGHRAGNQTAWTYLDGGTGDWHLNVDGNRLTATDEGNIGIGTTSPAHKLHVVTNAAGGRAVFGNHTATSGTTYGGYFSSASTLGSGVIGTSSNIGVEGQASGSSGIGIFGTGPSRGVFGNSTGANGMAGEFIATGSNSRGVYGVGGTGNSSYGVYGEITNAASAGVGVYGKAPSYGVTGEATSNGVGVIGRAPTGLGVYGESNTANGTGVMGANTAASGTTYGVYGIVTSSSGYAGYFTGGRNYFEGRVGLGTATPANPLSVAGDSDFSGRMSVGITGADARLLVRGVLGEDAFRVRVEGGTKLLVKDNGGVAIGSNFGTVPNDGLRVQGNVGIGIDPTDKLHVSGNIRATGSVFASCGTLSCSDRRFKTNIHPLTGALEMVQILQPISYDWKYEEFPDREFSSQRQTGLIAQQVRDVVPEVVQQDGDGYLSVDYGRLTPLLVEAVRELRAEKDEQIDSLQAQVSDLQSQIDQLKSLVSQLAAEDQ